MLYIQKCTSIRIIGDEFGYWAAGSWFAGWDWSEVASNNAYYGYGYGIILSIIMRLTANPIAQYRMAIILNFVMLTCVYMIIYCLINRLELWERGYVSSSVALVLTLYTGNIYHAQFSMTEPLLLLGYWGLIFLIYSIYKKADVYKVLIYIVLVAYLFTVHQRMIGVFAAAMFVLLCIQLKNRNWKQVVLSLGVACTLLILANSVKAYYQDTYLTAVKNSIVSVNDFGGQLKKIKVLFSIEGIKLLITGVIGKFFYIFSSSYLLGLLGMYEIAKHAMGAVKEKVFTYKEAVYLFSVLSTIALVCISTVFFFKVEERFDLLIYGRYSELVVSFFMLVGLFALIRDKGGSFKEHLVVIILYLGVLFVVQNTIAADAVKNFSNMNCSGINDILILTDRNIYAVGLKTIIVYAVVVFVLKVVSCKNMNAAVITVCVVLGANWFASFCYTYEEGTLSWSVAGCGGKEKQAELIRELGAQNDLYYYIPDNRLGVDALQFLLGDATIHCIYSEDEILSLPENAYVLTDYSTSLDQQMLLKNYALTSKSPYQLWKPKEEYEKVKEENVQNNRFQIGLDIFLEEYPHSDAKPCQLLRKWENWQDEMSYLVQMDGKHFSVIFSESGVEIEGLWIDISNFETGKWQDVVITFENGLVMVFVDDELKGFKYLSFDAVYDSDLGPIVGEDLEGVIRDVYISPIMDDYALISKSLYQSLKRKEEYEKVKEENVQNDSFQIGLDLFLEEYPDSDAEPRQLLRKWESWQDEMSYLIQMDGKYFAVIFSGSGTDTEGLWVDISSFETGKWQDVVITFEDGLVMVFVDNELKGFNHLSFDTVYNSDLVPIVGEDLKGVIRDVYISPIMNVAN